MLIKIKKKLYHFFVGNNVNVLREYNLYKRKIIKLNYIKCFIYVLKLNWIYKRCVTPNVSYEKKIMKYSFPESVFKIREERILLTEKLEAFDIIVFGIFDVLVLSYFDDRLNVFQVIGDRLYVPNFLEYRIEAENYVRRNNNNKGDFTLKNIYLILNKWCGIDVSIGMKTEEEVLMQFSLGNSYLKDIIKDLLLRNKTIMIIQETYYSKELISKLLVKCGYLTDIANYVYTERDKFDILLKTLNKDNKSIPCNVYIGNHTNFASFNRVDTWKFINYENPNQLGRLFRPFKNITISRSLYNGIVNNQLHVSNKKFEIWYEYGFTYGGILICEFCKWLNQIVALKKIDKLLFVSRDGYILEKIYNKYYKTETVDTEYIKFSRLASQQIIFEDMPEEFLKNVVRPRCLDNGNLTVEDLLNDINLSELLISLEIYGLSRIDKVSLSNYNQLKELFYGEKVTVSKKYEKAALAAQIYFTKMIGRSQNVCVVDLGWKGSSIAYLKYLIEKKYGLNVSISGAMVGATNLEYVQGMISQNVVSCYAFQNELYKGYGSNQFKHMSYYEILCIEALFSSAESTLLAYDLNDEGEVNFIYEERNDNAELIEQIQEGVMEFADIYSKFNTIINLNVTPQEAFEPLDTICRRKDFQKLLMKHYKERKSALQGFNNTKLKKILM